MSERPMPKANAANTVPTKKVEKVVKGTVKKKKKSEVSKFKDVFISEDANSVKNYIFMDVLVPSIKKALSDIVKDGIDMILYGDKRSGNRSNSSRVSYRDYSSGSGRRENNREIMDTYNVVTVADMYDLSGVTCNYTDNKYGWMNISNAQVIHGRDGYIIKMPRVVSID